MLVTIYYLTIANKIKKCSIRFYMLINLANATSILKYISLKMLNKATYINIFFILITLGLYSCTPGVNKFNNAFTFSPKRFVVINKINNWQLNGKLSWHDKKNNQTVICYVKWQKDNKKSYITLSSVMNLKTVNLEIDNGAVKIINNSNNADKLTQDIDNIIKNISINLDNLNYWLLGVPNPNNTYKLIQDGFEQHNCKINYFQYTNNSGVVLPAFISLQMKPEIIIKFIIKKFHNY